ncbi:hypothetical protein AB0939_11250 [Streptomyces sp. NPDC006990]|uniref:hypothetical protein n=1 Tax=unclassified Streptomyces TaxID=2593676 RepID=UPI00345296F3
MMMLKSIRGLALLAVPLIIAGTGCSGMGDGDEPSVRDVDDVRADAKKLSSQVLDVIDLRGKTTESGPGVGVCGDRDSSKYFTVGHPWSVYGVPVADMKEAMKRLKEELPKQGWKITKYGPNGSPAKNLTLKADYPKMKFSVQIELLEEPKESEDPSMIHVSLGSSCFKVPDGQDVTGEY